MLLLSSGGKRKQQPTVTYLMVLLLIIYIDKTVCEIVFTRILRRLRKRVQVSRVHGQKSSTILLI